MMDKFGEMVLNDPKVDEWFELIEAKPATRETYSLFIRQYCECTKMLPSEHIAEAINEIKAGKMGPERTILSYIVMFKRCLKDKDVSSNSFGLAMTAITSFYKAFDITLPARAGKLKKRNPLFENKSALTYDEVKHIIESTQNARERAMILLIATSGLARREVIDLQKRDIVFDDEGIGTISIRRQKTSVDFVTFTTPEFKEALENYYRERNREPKLAIKGDDSYVFVNYMDGGPLNPRTYVKLFQLMADRLEYQNPNKNRERLYNRMHSHAIRSFNSRRLEDVGCPRSLIDIFLGHTKNGVDKAYHDYDPNNPEDVKKLKERYKQYMKFLCFNSTFEISSLETKDKKKLEELDKELKRKDREAIELRQQLLEGNQKILDSKLEIDRMNQKFEQVEAKSNNKVKALEEKLAKFEQYIVDLQDAVKIRDKRYGFYTGPPKEIDGATAQKMQVEVEKLRNNNPEKKEEAKIDPNSPEAVKAQEKMIEWLEKRSPEDAKKCKLKKVVKSSINGKIGRRFII